MGHFTFDYYASQPSYGKHILPIWCDFVELLSINQIDKFIDRSIVYDVVFKEKGQLDPEESTADEDAELGEALDFEEDEDYDEFSDSEEEEEDKEVLPNAANRKFDNQNQKINEWFYALKSRETLLGDLYPFIVDDEACTIMLKSNLTPENNLYIFLLLSGSLRLFSNELEKKMTTDFEFTSYFAQKLIFASNIKMVKSETYCFGKNPELTSLFAKGNKRTKLTTLAKLIGAYKLDVSDIDVYDNGDAGIDVISYSKFFGDDAFGLPIAVGQSACSYSDWVKKQRDHYFENYRPYNLFRTEFLRLMFIPFFYRKADGQWFRPDRITTVLIDRLRILKIFDEAEIPAFVHPWVEMALEFEAANRDAIALTIVNRTAAA